ncbi:MAG: hypothetical protein B7Z54_02560 [Sphingobacteriales bacterium 12-47-4]|nr:MAG: hypothetical protein B7Z54_02560 [Sphingobacteriales bacterium 12-47-4]
MFKTETMKRILVFIAMLFFLFACPLILYYNIGVLTGMAIGCFFIGYYFILAYSAFIIWGVWLVSKEITNDIFG